MTIKSDILRDLQGDLMDSNHATRRYFRCFLEGGYDLDMRDTNTHYLRDALKKNGLGVAFENVDGGQKGWRVRLNSWTINQFVRFTAHDAFCSYGYAQKCIVDCFKTIDVTEGFQPPYPDYKHFLRVFTDELSEDACDLIEDYIKAEAA